VSRKNIIVFPNRQMGLVKHQRNKNDALFYGHFSANCLSYCTHMPGEHP
jgi:hypothetical protein